MNKSLMALSTQSLVRKWNPLSNPTTRFVRTLTLNSAIHNGLRAEGYTRRGRPGENSNSNSSDRPYSGGGRDRPGFDRTRKPRSDQPDRFSSRGGDRQRAPRERDGKWDRGSATGAKKDYDPRSRSDAPKFEEGDVMLKALFKNDRRERKFGSEESGDAAEASSQQGFSRNKDFDESATRSKGSSRFSSGVEPHLLEPTRGRPERSRSSYGDSESFNPRRSSFSDRPPRSDKFSSPGRESRPDRFSSDRPPRPDRFSSDRPPRSFSSDRPPRSDRFSSDRPSRSDRFSSDRFSSDRPPRSDRFSSDRPPRSDRSFSDRPPRSENFSSDRPSRYSRDEASSSSNAPEHMPVTNAISEWIYSRNAVTAALRAKRRHKFYVLYRIASSPTPADAEEDVAVALAREAGIKVEFVDQSWRPAFSRITTGAPHQGYMLEVSPFPVIPVVSLLTTTTNSQELHFLKPTTPMPKPASIPLSSPGRPVVALITSLSDPQNLGAILRSAHFFGISAVVLPSRCTVSPSAPAVASASSGASEAVPILEVKEIQAFVEASKRNGWFIAASMPPPKFENDTRKTVVNVPALEPVMSHAKSSKQPVLIVLGGEQVGVDARVARMADVWVTIGRKGEDTVGVDSLNVGVAAGVVFAEMGRDVGAYVSTEKNDDVQIESTEVMADKSEVEGLEIDELDTEEPEEEKEIEVKEAELEEEKQAGKMW
jgi:21S rRNA (GM2251-2'-O)-methyltransferase